MKSRFGLNDVGQFADFQIEGGIFEWFLHGATAKWTQIATTFSWTAVGVFLGQLFQCCFARFDLMEMKEIMS